MGGNMGGSQTAVRVTAEVLAGHRIEISVPELREGQQVDIIVIPRQMDLMTGPTLLEFLDQMPPGPRSAQTWEDVEQLFQEERDSWDR